MFFIIPIGHNRFVVNELPFVTFGIIALCLLLYFPASSRMDSDAALSASARAALMRHYNAHPQLQMPDELWDYLDSTDREVVLERVAWREWYAASPDEAIAWADAQQKVALSESRKASSNGMMDVMNPGVSIPGMGSDPAPLTASQRNPDELKALAISQLAEANESELIVQQQALDELAFALVDVRQSDILYRFGFSPSHPQFPGVFTHIFLHSDIIQLLFAMLFLWLAAVKLEDIWGRALFVALFLLFGVGAACGHMAQHPDSIVPVVGASGAVAGLMGAFVVRLARAKIKFFYLIWLFRLKPHTGVFEARAYFMLPVWFLGELSLWLFLDSGDVAYSAHLTGFLIGMAVAVAFRLTDFEAKVLGRDPDDDADVDEEEARMAAPLVAFQNLSPTPGPAAVASAPAPVLLKVMASIRARRELIVNSFEEGAVNVTTSGGQRRRFAAGEITAIALGRVERLEPELTAQIFAAGVPSDPAHVIVLVEGKVGDAASEPVLWFVDGQKCRWADLFPGHQLSTRHAMIALTRALLSVFPGVPLIQGGANGPDNISIYATLDNLIRTVEKKVVR